MLDKEVLEQTVPPVFCLFMLRRLFDIGKLEETQFTVHSVGFQNFGIAVMFLNKMESTFNAWSCQSY